MSPEPTTTRRDFLAASTLAGGLALAPSLFAGSNSALKIGLIGCGGRGTGAAKNALKADSNVQLVAMADMYDDQIKNSLNQLQKNKEIAAKVKVTPATCFTGFNAYKDVIAASDVVLLTTPPHFRPIHLKAAVEAGKHVFAEKPLAVDAPGIRSVIESAKKAKEKNLALLVGFCYRYEFAKRETVKRIHDGMIGDVTAIHCNYLANELWYRPIDKPFDTMEYQVKNWYYFTWLSGDHIVEQHCHNHDKAAWVLKGEYPVSCYGMGGRQKRTDPKWGNIFDHHTVIYDYKSGARVISLCRQMSGPGIFTETSDHVFGTKGSAELMKHTIAAGGLVVGVRRAKLGHVRPGARRVLPGPAGWHPDQQRGRGGAQQPDVDHGPNGHVHRAEDHLADGHELQGGPVAQELRLGPAQVRPGGRAGDHEVRVR